MIVRFSSGRPPALLTPSAHSSLRWPSALPLPLSPASVLPDAFLQRVARPAWRRAVFAFQTSNLRVVMPSLLQRDGMAAMARMVPRQTCASSALLLTVARTASTHPYITTKKSCDTRHGHTCRSAMRAVSALPCQAARLPRAIACANSDSSCARVSMSNPSRFPPLLRTSPWPLSSLAPARPLALLCSACSRWPVSSAILCTSSRTSALGDIGAAVFDEDAASRARLRCSITPTLCMSFCTLLLSALICVSTCVMPALRPRRPPRRCRCSRSRAPSPPPPPRYRLRWCLLCGHDARPLPRLARGQRF